MQESLKIQTWRLPFSPFQRDFIVYKFKKLSRLNKVHAVLIRWPTHLAEAVIEKLPEIAEELMKLGNDYEDNCEESTCLMQQQLPEVANNIRSAGKGHDDTLQNRLSLMHEILVSRQSTPTQRKIQTPLEKLEEHLKCWRNTFRETRRYFPDTLESKRRPPKKTTKAKMDKKNKKKRLKQKLERQKPRKKFKVS